MITEAYFVIAAVTAGIAVVVVTLVFSWDPDEKRFYLQDGAADIGPLYVLFPIVGVAWPLAILAGIMALIVWIVARLIEGVVRR